MAIVLVRVNSNFGYVACIYGLNNHYVLPLSSLLSLFPFISSLFYFPSFFHLFFFPYFLLSCSFFFCLFLSLTLQSNIYSYLSQYFMLIIFNLPLLSCFFPSERVADRSHLNCLNCSNKFGSHLSPT